MMTRSPAASRSRYFGAIDFAAQARTCVSRRGRSAANAAFPSRPIAAKPHISFLRQDRSYGDNSQRSSSASSVTARRRTPPNHRRRPTIRSKRKPISNQVLRSPTPPLFLARIFSGLVVFDKPRDSDALSRVGLTIGQFSGFFPFLRICRDVVEIHITRQHRLPLAIADRRGLIELGFKNARGFRSLCVVIIIRNPSG